MNRTLLAAAAGILCAAVGLRQAVQLQRDAASLSRWCTILSHLSLLMRSGFSLPHAFESCATQQRDPDRLLRELAKALRSRPLTPLASHADPLLPAGNSRAALLRMFTGLGHGSLEMRLHAVMQAQEELQLMQKDAADRADKDARLLRTLGITAGICLTLMLL